MQKQQRYAISLPKLRSMIREELEESFVTEDATSRTEEEAKQARADDTGTQNVELSKAALKMKDLLSKATEGISGRLSAALETAGFDFKSLIELLDQINSHPGNYTSSKPSAPELVSLDRRAPSSDRDNHKMTKR